MVQFSVIKASEAPQAPKVKQAGRLAKRMAEMESTITGLKPGQVGRIVPGEGETSRGLKLQIARAAIRLGFNAKGKNTVGNRVTFWDVDGVAYFTVAAPADAPAPKAKRTKAPKNTTTAPEGETSEMPAA